MTLGEGINAGIKHYVWASEEQIKYIFNSCSLGDNVLIVIEMGHIVGQKKGEITDKICFQKGMIGSLVFECQNEETVNKCFKYWKLPFNYSDGKSS